MKRLDFEALLLLIGMLILGSNIQPIRSGGVIYIRSDGSIDPYTAPIMSDDNVTYIFTDDILDEVVVERDNIVVEGEDHCINGTTGGIAIDLSHRFNVEIRNVAVLNLKYGILLNYTSNCSIVKSSFSGNLYGVVLCNSPHNNISRNEIVFSGKRGIYFSNSSSNTVCGNTMKNCRNGMYFDGYSNHNMVLGNQIERWGEHGIYFHLSCNNTISGNDVIARWESFQYLYHGVKLVGSCNNTISVNTIAMKKVNNFKPSCIYLCDSSNNNLIFGNNVTAQQAVCIKVDSSHGNSIVRNNIKEGDYGACFWSSSNNTIYHNNFLGSVWSQALDEGNNSWDDGYPSGGNYWSDYNGTDSYHGTSQNLTGSDGIGDTPHYITDECAPADNYPLVSPWLPPDIALVNITPSQTIISKGFNSSVHVTVKNQGHKIEQFGVELYINESSISSQEVILTNGTSTILTFSWSSASFVKGDYVVSGYVRPVLYEGDTVDNEFTDGMITVVHPGDLNNDGVVDIVDVVLLTGIYGSECGDSEYNPNVDVIYNCVIDIADVVVVTGHYGEVDP